MTQDEIIDMAIQAGASPDENKIWLMYAEEIETFAKLVAAKEREALAQPEQFCDANCVWTDHHPDCKLAQPQQEPVEMYRNKCADGSRCLHGCHTNEPCYTHPPQRIEQEPVAWMYQEYRDDDQFGWRDEILFTPPPNDPIYFRNITPLYTHPPQRTEQNFCSRCGKRVGGIDSIHTCTPPMEKNT